MADGANCVPRTCLNVPRRLANLTHNPPATAALSPADKAQSQAERKAPITLWDVFEFSAWPNSPDRRMLSELAGLTPEKLFCVDTIVSEQPGQARRQYSRDAGFADCDEHAVAR